MEIPRYPPRDPGGGPPSIYIESSNHYDHFRNSGRPNAFNSQYSPPLSSTPMSIPESRRVVEDDVAPPPLPPPRYLPGLGEPPRPEQMNHHARGPVGESWRTEESGYGSPGRSLDSERNALKRRPGDRSMFSDRDEGYHSLASTLSTTQDSLPKKLFMSHDQFQFRPCNNNDYDNALLKKFDARRTLENRSPPRRSTLSASATDAASQRVSPGDRMHSLLTPLSLPIRSNHTLLVESPGHFTDTPLHSAVSPGSTPYFGNGEYRSPVEPTETDRISYARPSRSNSGPIPDDVTVSTQESYENSADETDYHSEEGGIKRLHIDDSMIRSEYHVNGLKRRASSPPGDEPPLPGLPGSSDLFRRREGPTRASPTPRLAGISHGSVSSVSSAGRSGSYASNMSLTATSVTSMNSFDRRSPGGVSPGGLSPVDGVCHNSPFSTSMAMTHSPRSPISRAPQHPRVVSDSRPLVSPRKLNDVPKSAVSRIQGFFMCECCPKKPKKFETAEELSAHEAEKQYECSFCGNRFKNKNEAERHQNSLHVRRHSWSCSALHVAGFDKAFHDSSSRPGEADTCGYCGEDFPRSGGAGRTRHPTDQDWDDRLRHLQEVHKFRECNSSKKFYRADHFRQHLKHSHAGTSGKWTNMLETACMIEEEPAQPR